MYFADFFFSLDDMKNPRCMEESAEARFTMHGNNLAEEMRELRRLTSDFMMEKLVNRNEGVSCPKPSRRRVRQCREQTDLKIGPDPWDILIASKASPPYYSGSPPVRASNPLIQDAHFIDAASSPSLALHSEVIDVISCQRRTSRSISSVA